jgi:hypothetical protein
MAGKGKGEGVPHNYISIILHSSYNPLQVYAFHHRARLPPRGPFTPTLLSSSATTTNTPLLLAHASAHGIAAWLFLSATPSTGPTPTLLPFRLLLQNHAHDAALVPYQRLRLVAPSSPSDAKATPTRVRTISSLSVGTSHAAGSSASSSSGSASDGEEAEEEEGDGSVDAFFLNEEKGEEAPKPAKKPPPPQQLQRKPQGAGAGPWVVARNERRLEGDARIPWRRFKVRTESDDPRGMG